MIKREIALEITSRMEDEDLINWNASALRDEVYKDCIDLIESVLLNYIMLKGEIIE